MDREKELALVKSAECAVAVLGNAVTMQYALIDMDEPPMCEASILDARQRGFGFVGWLSIKAGLADVVCEPGAGALSLMCAAVVPFMERYAAKLAPKSDGADWLERLAALPDTRTDNV